MTGQEKALKRAYEMMREREKYWGERKHRDLNRVVAYGSCAQMLWYAIAEDWEGLNQYDIYGE